MERHLVHATCVAMPDTLGGIAGVLLLGPSGAGKSDLALRLIDAGAELVADDQTSLFRRDAGVWAAAPESLAGLMEVRGLGIIQIPHRAKVQVTACFDLVEATKIERLPEPKTRTFLGVSLPSLDLFPFETSTQAKLRLAVREMSGFIMDQD